MFYSADVRHERFWRVGIARNAVFFHSFVASKARKGRSEKRGGAEDRLPKMSTKFAPRLRARAIRKSKSLKTGMFGALLEVDIDKICTTPARESDFDEKKAPRCMFGALFEVELRKICTTPARESDSEVKIVKNWRSRDVFGGWKWFSRGRRRDFDTLQNTWQAQEFVRVAKTLAGVVDLTETMRFAWQAQWFRSLWCRCLKPPTQNPWTGCKFHVTEVLFCSDHFAWRLQDLVCLGSTFSWQAQYFWSVHLKIVKMYWNSEVKCLVNLSFLKEVSQKCFVFDLQSCIFEGSLAQKLRFWASKLHFWRKSRRKVSFLSFKASCFKEVSHKSFVFELQSVFLEEVSQKSFVWQNHLNHTSVDNQITWTSNHFTSKSFESQINWQPTHLNLKAIDNQIIWISDQLTTESLGSQINWQPHHLKFKSTDNQNHLKHTSIDNQIIWISNQLTTKSIESQVNWQPKSFESQIRWQPNHLTLNSFESDINWLSNQLNSARSLPIGSLSLETSATALCGRYVKLWSIL